MSFEYWIVTFNYRYKISAVRLTNLFTMPSKRQITSCKGHYHICDSCTNRKLTLIPNNPHYSSGPVCSTAGTANSREAECRARHSRPLRARAVALTNSWCQSNHVRTYLTNPRKICAWIRLTRIISTVIWRIFLLLLFNLLRLYSPSGRDVSLSTLYSFFSLVLGVWYLYPYFNLVYY